MLPREYSYTKEFTGTCVPLSTQARTHLASRGNLRCRSSCLGVTLLFYTCNILYAKRRFSRIKPTQCITRPLQ